MTQAKRSAELTHIKPAKMRINIHTTPAIPPLLVVVWLLLHPLMWQSPMLLSSILALLWVLFHHYPATLLHPTWLHQLVGPTIWLSRSSHPTGVSKLYLLQLSHTRLMGPSTIISMQPMSTLIYPIMALLLSWAFSWMEVPMLVYLALTSVSFLP